MIASTCRSELLLLLAAHAITVFRARHWPTCSGKRSPLLTVVPSASVASGYVMARRLAPEITGPLPQDMKHGQRIVTLNPTLSRVMCRSSSC